MKKKKKKIDANLKRAMFHTEIYHDSVESVVNAYSDEEARKELFDILNPPGFAKNRIDDTTYFKALSELLSETAWDHLLPADKALFFKNWYVAISDEYLKAFTYFQMVYPKFKGIAYYLEAAMHDKKKFANYFGTSSGALIARLKAECDNMFWKDIKEGDRYLYVLCLRVFGITIDKAGRDRDLSLSFRKQLLDRMDNVAAYSLQTEPAWLATTPMNVEDLKQLRNQVGVVPIFVNLKYEKNVITKSIKCLIEKEQEQFFSQCPEQKPIYMKEDIKGRKDTYPFDEWARYLDFYILRKQKIPLKQIGDQFYPSNAAPIRQVGRDKKKAEGLSKNAVQGNFPGSY